MTVPLAKGCTRRPFPSTSAPQPEHMLGQRFRWDPNPKSSGVAKRSVNPQGVRPCCPLETVAVRPFQPTQSSLSVPGPDPDPPFPYP